ncbi:MAG: linear amide C-N hydrolase [Candidatus Bipolaricaulota bacterium]|nr:MAG: linear amide C-N hydrolase [Candidatus Bipolaricaulota bacterium]
MPRTGVIVLAIAAVSLALLATACSRRETVQDPPPEIQNPPLPVEVDDLRDTAVTRFAGLSPAAIEALRSLKKLDPYPLYMMSIEGDPVSAGGISSDLAWGCSLFAALAADAPRLLGRNFDWEFSPALLLFHTPSDGYSSVAMVDIAYLVSPEDVDRLLDLPLERRVPLLGATRFPFDGMNQNGLAIGLAAVPATEMPFNPALRTVGSLGAMREVLDHASTVAEALEILHAINIDMSGGPSVHYLIADAAGDAALVEFYDGRVVIEDNEEAWHVATNFLRCAAGGDASGICERYDRLWAALSDREGRLTVDEAFVLLSDVAQPARTQWSAVYHLSDRAVSVRMGDGSAEPYRFDLETVETDSARADGEREEPT